MDTTLKITTVNPSEYGIAENQASELVGNLPQIKAEREILSKQYDEVVLLDIEDMSTSVKARELRLRIRDNRTKGIDIWHRTTKDFFLKGGQFVDAIKRQEVAINQRMEENLESIEKYAENKENERKSQLNADRISELQPYNAFVPIGLNFGEISEEEYQKVLNGAKLQYEAEKESERKAEAERIRLAEIKSLHNSRKESLLPIWQFIENKEMNFGELSEDDFSTILSLAQKKQNDFEVEQEKIRKENERLAKEKQALEEKAKKEKEVAAKKLANEKAKQEAKLKAEREERAKLEAELQAKKDAEKKAEKERLALEEKAKKDAEKLAKAPIKEQLNNWINSFEIPITHVENEKVKLISAKFEAFKNWAKSEVETI